MSTKRALITGITGQDGSYLAEFLLEKGYQVIGMVRRSSTVNFERIEHIQDQITLASGDLMDQISLIDVVETHRPNEVYNLAAQSFVGTSWNVPLYTCNTNAIGTLRLLDAIRIFSPATKLYNASSSEMFGLVQDTPQNEMTYHYPRSPYGCSKCFAHDITRNYRESYGLFCCNGICFNHESSRRGVDFITRKITMSISKILNGKQDRIVLGNLDAKRDWGFAPDYVYAMYLMLQQNNPDDFIIATGIDHSVRHFVEAAFSFVGINIEWVGHGISETGIDGITGRILVEVSTEFFRPADVNFLLGDPSKAKRILGWEPKVDFEELVQIMMKADLEKEGVKIPCVLRN